MTKKWVWVDLEMTGLDIDKHRIIEIASIIFDRKKKIIVFVINLIFNSFN